MTRRAKTIKEEIIALQKDTKRIKSIGNEMQEELKEIDKNHKGENDESRIA